MDELAAGLRIEVTALTLQAAATSRPAHACEVPDTACRHLEALGCQQGAFECEVAVAAEHATRGDHAVVGNARPVRSRHHVADGPGSTRPARKPRDIAVGGHASRRNAGYGGQHPPGEEVTGR